MSECTHDCSSCSSNCSSRKNESLLKAPHKKSYIKIEKNSKNENFIKQFWDKPIKEYKTYPNYPNL